MEKPERQGLAWSVEEEQSLYNAFTSGAAIRMVAQDHKRTDGAIRSHLKLMGLVDDFGVSVDPIPPFSPSAPVLKRMQKGTRAEKKTERKQPVNKKATQAEKIEIDKHAKDILFQMENHKGCLFITGKAGTGKSTLLSHFCQTTKREVVVLAPTGVAALNIKGQTIHSFFNFYVDVTPQKIREKKTKPRNAKLYKKLQIIVIDEISMVRADLLDCIDAFLRIYGPHAGQSFGGVQMIFIGDLYQLPPVVSSHEREFFSSHYETPYFFSAPCLKDLPVVQVELDKIYRQKDKRFVELLNQIRSNDIAPSTLHELNARHSPDGRPPTGSFFITLTTTNKRADEINQQHLEALSGKVFTSEADIEGTFTKDYFPTSPALQFKVGAQIMMLNNDSHKRWVNGSIGIIRALKHDIEQNDYLEVILDGHEESVEVYPHSWEVYRFAVEHNSIVAQPVGTFTQFPFRLAWAITIHKSQGKTFDHVMIDLGQGTFAAGQLYVALSRCTSLEGIILKTPIKPHHIRTDTTISNFLHCRRTGETVPPDSKTHQIQDAINKCCLLEIVYLKGDNSRTTRLIRPLKIGIEMYKGHSFLGLRALCTLRNDERLFSVERILSLKPVQAA